MSAKMALPPRKAKGSSRTGVASKRRQRSENVMMDSMSFPTPKPFGPRCPSSFASESDSPARLRPALSALSPSPTSDPSALLLLGVAFSRFSSSASSPNESRGMTANPMKLVWSLDMPATSAVTMAAAAEANVTKGTGCRANRSPHSTCRSPAPAPPAISPSTVSGALPIHSPAGITMPLATRAAGVRRIRTECANPSSRPALPQRAIRDTASALAAPDARYSHENDERAPATSGTPRQNTIQARHSPNPMMVTR